MKVAKITNIMSYIRLMGIDWLVFRLKYYRKTKYNFFIKNDSKILERMKKIDDLVIPKWFCIYSNDIEDKSKYIKIADNAINGKIVVFSNEELNFGNPKKWHYNPLNQYEIENSIHWSKIPDFGELGDIKIPWELSRFPHFFSYIKAHKITQDKKYINAFIDDVESWLQQNQFPNGINYKCGQEMTFRVFSILIAVNYFYKYLDGKLLNKISKYLLVSGYRIEENIDYAVVSVRNDHAISESIGLIILGLLFHNKIDDARRWFEIGKKILLDELDKQIYSDGAYLCHSFNYQREVLDELSLLLLILKNNYDVEIELIEKIQFKNAKMISFLNSFVQENGWLPNYGSNDGANLFPIANADYRDFRPSLNFASAVTNGYTIYNDNSDLVDFFSLHIDSQKELDKFNQFKDGGYYTIENDDLFLFIRCHSYKDRPSQNDMLHLDIWYKGENIFCDTGTYSYNTDKKFQNNFIGVTGHNTIMINDDNQMEQVLNFGWSNWTKSKLIDINENSFEGEHYGYQKKYGVTCYRRVELEEHKITIIDKVSPVKNSIDIKQLWNTKEEAIIIDEFTIRVDKCILKSNYPLRLDQAYISDYYNSYKDGTKIVIAVQTNKDIEIKTTMEFSS